jgi:hypothetical protein
MSIATLKKKTGAMYYKNHTTTRGPVIYWKGPYHAPIAYGNQGFSINGPYRNIGYIGSESKFSKAHTPFKGVHPVGHGGTYGTYKANPVIYNVSPSFETTRGNQSKYNKTSVISTYGMLRERFKWAYSGEFPMDIIGKDGVVERCDVDGYAC